jgi:hypothetical protein
MEDNRTLKANLKPGLAATIGFKKQIRQKVDERFP